MQLRISTRSSLLSSFPFLQSCLTNYILCFAFWNIVTLSSEIHLKSSLVSIALFTFKVTVMLQAGDSLQGCQGKVFHSTYLIFESLAKHYVTRSSNNHLSHSISTTHYHCTLLNHYSTFLLLIVEYNGRDNRTHSKYRNTKMGHWQYICEKIWRSQFFMNRDIS